MEIIYIYYLKIKNKQIYNLNKEINLIYNFDKIIDIKNIINKEIKIVIYNFDYLKLFCHRN